MSRNVDLMVIQERATSCGKRARECLHKFERLISLHKEHLNPGRSADIESLCVVLLLQKTFILWAQKFDVVPIADEESVVGTAYMAGTTDISSNDVSSLSVEVLSSFYVGSISVDSKLEKCRSSVVLLSLRTYTMRTKDFTQASSGEMTGTIAKKTLGKQNVSYRLKNAVVDG